MSAFRLWRNVVRLCALVMMPAALVGCGASTDTQNLKMTAAQVALPPAEAGVWLVGKVLGEDSEAHEYLLEQFAFLNRNAHEEELAEYFDKIEPHYRRVLAIRERAHGPNSRPVFGSLVRLARLNESAGKLAAAEPIRKRAVAVARAAYGAKSPEHAASLIEIGLLYARQQKSAQRELALKQVLALGDSITGPDSKVPAADLTRLAHLLRWSDDGQSGMAETIYRRALALIPADGKISDRVGILVELGTTLMGQQRTDEAQKILEQALAACDSDTGWSNIDAQSRRDLRNYALYLALRNQPNPALKEAGIRKELARIRSTNPVNWDDEASQLRSLHFILEASDRMNEADRVLQQMAKNAQVNALTQHYIFTHIGSKLAERDRADEARPYLERATQRLDADLKRSGSWNEDETERTNIARGHVFRKDWQTAHTLLLPITDRIVRRGTLGAQSQSDLSARSAMARDVLKSGESAFHLRALAAYQLSRTAASPVQRAALEDEAFQMLQWAQRSEAETALRQMTARAAAANPVLAELARRRHDLLAPANERDLVSATATASIGEVTSQPTPAIVSDRIAIDERLKLEFPNYARLLETKPLSIAAAKALLDEDEVLLNVVWAGSGLMIAVADRKAVRFATVDLPFKTLDDAVDSLRCGLDAGSWQSAKSVKRCEQLLKGPASIGAVLAFDLATAHQLYKWVLEPFREQIKSRRIIIVASRPLQKIPLQVLVSEPPRERFPATMEGYRQANWLGRQNGIAVLPSLMSLQALRGVTRGTAAPDNFLGIGNPVLSGGPTCGQAAVPAACPTHVATASSSTGEGSAMPLPRSAGSVRGAVKPGAIALQAKEIRQLCPLPDTAYELDCVARSVGQQTELVLGPKATVREIKAMSASGRLARYRIVHFATHGLMPGNDSAYERDLPEPALVLTPVDGTASGSNGLLMASEIAQLKLNADWVVLSACNTASGRRKDAEALSGLTRAFFAAGARALLVSHWEVYSEAAVKLTTRTFTALRENPALGRANALRDAIASVVDDGGFAAHPSYWAPFVVVGEGR